jgi:hypothetical protein
VGFPGMYSEMPTIDEHSDFLFHANDKGPRSCPLGPV